MVKNQHLKNNPEQENLLTWNCHAVCLSLHLVYLDYLVMHYYLLYAMPLHIKVVLSYITHDLINKKGMYRLLYVHHM